ncbi:hypothetical protein C8R47DRAFT_1303729 [Mycena vitilis]|nr:hypothetical protein C8R47DRAFT_1303729 [Mycena vitilis]
MLDVHPVRVAQVLLLLLVRALLPSPLHLRLRAHFVPDRRRRKRSPRLKPLEIWVLGNKHSPPPPTPRFISASNPSRSRCVLALLDLNLRIHPQLHNVHTQSRVYSPVRSMQRQPASDTSSPSSRRGGTTFSWWLLCLYPDVSDTSNKGTAEEEKEGGRRWGRKGGRRGEEESERKGRDASGMDAEGKRSDSKKRRHNTSSLGVQKSRGNAESRERDKERGVQHAAKGVQRTKGIRKAAGCTP